MRFCKTFLPHAAYPVLQKQINHKGEQRVVFTLLVIPAHEKQQKDYENIFRAQTLWQKLAQKRADSAILSRRAGFSFFQNLPRWLAFTGFRPGRTAAVCHGRAGAGFA